MPSSPATAATCRLAARPACGNCSALPSKTCNACARPHAARPQSLACLCELLRLEDVAQQAGCTFGTPVCDERRLCKPKAKIALTTDCTIRRLGCCEPDAAVSRRQGSALLQGQHSVSTPVWPSRPGKDISKFKSTIKAGSRAQSRMLALQLQLLAWQGGGVAVAETRRAWLGRASRQATQTRQ